MRGKQIVKWFLYVLAFLVAQDISGAKAIPGNIVPVGQLTVNLAGGSVKDLKVLEVTTVLELERPGYARSVGLRLGRIKWEIILFLGGKSREDVNSRAKQMRLRKNIIDHLNTLLKKKVFKNIFFTEFVIR